MPSATSVTTAPRHRPDYARLGLLGWFHFLNDGAANYLPGVLPAVLAGLALDTRYAGMIMSALLVGQSLQIFSGWLADRIGGRWLIVLGLLGSSVGATLIGLAPSVAWLVPALLAIGASNALFHPQALAGVRRLSGQRPDWGVALFLVGGEIGRGVWPLIASVLVSAAGVRMLSVLGLPALISLAWVGRSLPRQPVSAPHNPTPIAWRRHLPPLAVLVAFSMLRALAIFGTVTYIPVLWHAQGRPLVDGAGAIAVMLVIGIVGNIGAGHLADRVGRRAVLAGSSLACAALLALFLAIHGAAQWAILGALGIALFAALPLGIVIGQDMVPENPSMGSGVALGLSNGLAALALIGLGPLAAALGLPWVFRALAMACVLAAAIAMVMPLRAPAARARQRQDR